MNTESRVLQRVLVPLDGSPAGEVVLPFVDRLARQLDIEILLLRVVGAIPAVALETPRRVVVDIEQHRRDADEYLKGVADRLAASGLKVQTAVRVGDSAAQIAEAAIEREADFIAMASHGRSALGRLFYGSVAEDVLRQSAVPIMITRVPESQAARQAA